MAGYDELTLRERIEELFTQLRHATAAALHRQSVVASKLDDSRSELERLLMLERFDERDAMRAIGRAQLMLDAWRGIVGVPAVGRAR
jgi:hypothetical protein